MYSKGGTLLYSFNELNNNITYHYDTKGIEMIELIFKEINEDNNSTGFLFYLEQKLDYNSSESNEKESDKNHSEKNNSKLIIIITVSIVSIAIIIVLIVILMNFYKNKKLSNDISKISFEGERESNLLLE